MVKHKDTPPRPIFIRDDSPLAMDMEAGKYFWCACGRTRNQAFCDGSHHKTGIRPKRVVLKKPERVYWCMCKHTATPPFCDGTHHTLKGQAGSLAEEQD